MRRFAKRTFSRRPKAPTQWVTGGFTGATATSPANATLTSQLLCGEGAVDVETEPSIDRFKLERIVGDVVVVNNGAAVSVFGMGVVRYASTLGAPGNTTANLPDPTNVNDSGAPWLWLLLDACESNSQQGAVHQRYHVDIKVKRILRPNDGIWLMYKTTLSALSFYWNLRCLISKVA